MKICVFGAASYLIDDKYIARVEKLCKGLAEKGHELVFGAGANGLMGAAARGTKAGGGRITGVIPGFFREERIEAIYDGCDETIFTETMQERKKTMEDLSDAFIITPGGIGTFEEFFEVLTLKQLGRHTKPIAIYNIDGYYNNLMEFMYYCSGEKFINDKCHELYFCTDDEEELAAYLEDGGDTGYTVKDLKQG